MDLPGDLPYVFKTSLTWLRFGRLNRSPEDTDPRPTLWLSVGPGVQWSSWESVSVRLTSPQSFYESTTLGVPSSVRRPPTRESSRDSVSTLLVHPRPTDETPGQSPLPSRGSRHRHLLPWTPHVPSEYGGRVSSSLSIGSDPVHFHGSEGEGGTWPSLIPPPSS